MCRCFSWISIRWTPGPQRIHSNCFLSNHVIDIFGIYFKGLSMIRYIAIQISVKMQNPQRINPKDIGDLWEFPLAPPVCQILYFNEGSFCILKMINTKLCYMLIVLSINFPLSPPWSWNCCSFLVIYLLLLKLLCWISQNNIGWIGMKFVSIVITLVIWWFSYNQIRCLIRPSL